MAYSDYLQSAGWKKRRQVAIERSGGTCEACGRRSVSQVHHVTYERLGAELPSDLLALCVRCHQKEHPEKQILSPGWTYTAARDCEMYPSLVADFFQVGKSVRAICRQCGHTTAEYLGRPSKRERDRAPRTEGVPCPVCCTRPYSLAKSLPHVEARHPKPPRPTLEELEHDRRERERDKVLAGERLRNAMSHEARPAPALPRAVR